MLKTKYLFNPAEKNDGLRILVGASHLIPGARLCQTHDCEMPGLAPPSELIEEEWGAFRRKYILYLRKGNVQEDIKELAEICTKYTMTLLSHEKDGFYSFCKILGDEFRIYKPQLTVLHY